MTYSSAKPIYKYLRGEVGVSLAKSSHTAAPISTRLTGIRIVRGNVNRMVVVPANRDQR